MIDAIAGSRGGTAQTLQTIARPGDRDAEPRRCPKLQCPAKVPGCNWGVGSGLYTHAVDQEVRAAAGQQLALCLLRCLLVLLAIGVVTTMAAVNAS